MTPTLPRALASLVFALAASFARPAAPSTTGTFVVWDWDPPAEGASLTVYQGDFALVRELRRGTLPEGRSALLFGGLPETLQADTVDLAAGPSARGLDVLEVVYTPALTRSALLARFLGREVEVVRRETAGGVSGESTQARLLAFEPGGGFGLPAPPAERFVLQMGDRVYLEPPGEVVLPALPEGMYPRPHLRVEVVSERGGDGQLELRYLAGGFGWGADYVAVPRRGGSSLDLRGYVTVENRTTVGFPNASLRLVAGDVRRVSAPPPSPVAYRMEAADMRAQAPAFEAGTLGETHTYDLDRRTSIGAGERKRIELFSAEDVPFVRSYVYDGSGGGPWPLFAPEGLREDPSWNAGTTREVGVFLELTRGVPGEPAVALPAGVVRVYEEDTEGALAFTGEDRIPHTAPGEKVRISTGTAFDLVGERRQTGFERLGEHGAEESIEIVLRNRKDSPVEITVVERLTRAPDWKVTASSRPFEKIDGRTIEFRVPIAAGAEERVTYSVRYEW